MYSMRVSLNKKSGFYKSGETVVCKALLLKDGKPVKGETLRCTVKKELVESGVTDVVCNGKAQTFTAAMDRPGWLLFSFSVIGRDGKPLTGRGVYRHLRKPAVVGEIGAVFDKDQIFAKPCRPADFDEFWANELKRLDEMPMDPVIKEIEPVPTAAGKVKCYTIEVKCPGRHPVTGYMAIPIGAKAKSLPIVVDYLSMVWNDASRLIACTNAHKANAVALYISWHGMETGHPKKWYKANSSWYDSRSGADKKGQWIQHDMMLRSVRACHFAMTIPEWNGKDLIVRGGSLGGIQSFTAAALVPEVTVAMISVSSGCEYNAHFSGRTPAALLRTYPELRNNQAIVDTLAYYDGLNFAPLIKCDAYVSAGFTDECCFPSNIIAFYNALTAAKNKFLSTSTTGGHYGLTRNKEAEKRVSKGLNSVFVYR